MPTNEKHRNELEGLKTKTAGIRIQTTSVTRIIKQHYRA
jgi:hypothetical protein